MTSTEHNNTKIIDEELYTYILTNYIISQEDNKQCQSYSMKFKIPKKPIMDPTGYWGPYNILKKINLPIGPIGICINGIPIVSNITIKNDFNYYMKIPKDIEIHGCDSQKNNTNICIKSLKNLIEFQIKNKIHSNIIGFMFDGFPIYGPIGFKNSVLKIMKSSYLSDKTFDENNGDLDICNGHYGPTPDFPDGIYHYHFTIDADKENNIILDSNDEVVPSFPYSINLFRGIPEVVNFMSDEN